MFRCIRENKNSFFKRSFYFFLWINMGHTYISKFPDRNGIIPWNQTEHKIWSSLIDRQKTTIIDRACPEFIDGLRAIWFSHTQIPKFSEVNKKLSNISGWNIEAVPALISDVEFHTLLSQRRFPAASFIRIPEEFDYIEQPDIFHEFFWHIPLLTNKKYADFLQKFWKYMLSIDPKFRNQFARIFWFTIEFWLIESDEWLRICGAGILSSHSESIRAIEDPNVERIPFNILECARTPYRYDIMQSKYFILKDFDNLFEIFDNSLIEILIKAHTLGDITS